MEWARACLLSLLVVRSLAGTVAPLLQVVFVHTTIPGSCGPLPDHLKTSLLQAQRASKNGTSAKVVILGNFKQCRWALDELKNGGDADLKRVATAESMSIKSTSTQEWEKLVRNLVPKGVANEDLLLTSFYRYFMLEDYMTYNNITGHVLHLDADTLLYADPASFSAALQAGYPRLGLAPSIHRRFLSASALYVGSLAALRKMNGFFTSVASNKTSGAVGGGGGSGTGSVTANGAAGTASTALMQYANWLRGFACCKPIGQGGLLGTPGGSGGDGVRPWAVNDMTLLAYYRTKNHKDVRLFPLLPGNLASAVGGSAANSSAHAAESVETGANGTMAGSGGGAAGDHLHHSSGQAVHLYAEGGAEAGPALGGLVDSSGGWGAHLPSSSLAGAGAPESSSSASPVVPAPATVASGAESATSSSPRATDRHAVVEQAVLRYGCKVRMRCAKPACLTEPVVSCGTGPETPLLTLHLHPKHRDKAKEFSTTPCACA